MHERDYTMHELFSLFVFGTCFLFLLFVGTPAHAQVFGQSAQAFGVTLVPDVQFPAPNTSVKVSLNDYHLDTTGATISWYVNGTERGADRNNRSIVVETGDLGERSAVRAVLSRTNAPTVSGSLEIVPVVIDIVLEAETYVPSFYHGRALPSKESAVRAVAVVHDASKKSDAAYTYKWSKNGKVLLGGAVQGKHIYEFTMPVFPDDWLTVEVFDATGKALGEKSMSLTPTNPELHFYEKSPLRGLFQKEVGDTMQLIGEETTIYGEPYFMGAQVDASAADFEWKIDGVKTTPDAESPNAITLRHTGGSGEARIGFSMITKRSMPQFVEETFNLLFQ